MTEVLNLKGKWWLPDTDGKKFEGTLTFDNHLRRGILSIVAASIFEAKEIGSKDKHDIILGETSEGEKVTLNYCERRASHYHLHAPSEYSFTTNNILLGWHFKRPEDIVFSSIYVTYQGDQMNRWIKRIYAQARFESRDSIDARIGDKYVISITAKRRSSSVSEVEVQKESFYLEHCIELKPLNEGKESLEEYLRVNSSVLDFLNFIIPEEVYIESIYGIRESEKVSENIFLNQQERKKEEVKIFYASAVTSMFKPSVKSQPIFPYNESQMKSMPNLFENYLNKWFELSKMPLINLYCAVMYNPQMYIEYLFLGLTQAVESYHAKFIRAKSQEKIKLQEEIRQIGRELSGEKAKRLEEMTKHCFDASLQERVAAVYHEYAGVADSLFKFKGEQEFSKKVKDTRNYLTHWSEDGETKAAHGDDLFFLTRDLQLLVQLCIMTQLGFTAKDITKMYNVYYDRMRSLQEEDPDFFEQLMRGGDTL